MIALILGIIPLVIEVLKIYLDAKKKADDVNAKFVVDQAQIKAWFDQAFQQLNDKDKKDDPAIADAWDQQEKNKIP